MCGEEYYGGGPSNRKKEAWAGHETRRGGYTPTVAVRQGRGNGLGGRKATERGHPPRLHRGSSAPNCSPTSKEPPVSSYASDLRAAAEAERELRARTISSCTYLAERRRIDTHHPRPPAPLLALRRAVGASGGSGVWRVATAVQPLDGKVRRERRRAAWTNLPALRKNQRSGPGGPMTTEARERLIVVARHLRGRLLVRGRFPPASPTPLIGHKFSLGVATTGVGILRGVAMVGPPSRPQLRRRADVGGDPDLHPWSSTPNVKQSASTAQHGGRRKLLGDQRLIT